MSGDKLIKEILDKTKTIAVVGLSPKEHRTSHMVASYLQDNGYRIIPVYPREDKILGEKVYRTVSEIPGRIDTVCIFRKSEEVFPVVQDAVKKKPKYIWMQQGIVNEKARELAEKKGISVVMDKCMYREHGRM